MKGYERDIMIHMQDERIFRSVSPFFCDSRYSLRPQILDS